MDYNQLMAKINWLDEERRKDKSEIAALTQRLIGTENESRDMAKHIKQLEADLAQAQAQLARLPRFDEALDKLRQEIILMIEEQEGRRKASERELEKLRRVELESQAKALAEFKRELAPLPRLQEELPLRRAEEQRLNALLGTLSHQVAQIDERIDERVRDVSYIEESMRQDSRRLAELQAEVTELRKRVDARLPRVDVLEEQIVRAQGRVSELVALEVERKQDHTKFIEQYAMLARERDRRMEQWSVEMGEVHARVESYAKRIEAYGELQQIVNTTLMQLESLRQRLEQRQNEVGEVQRLNEERFKQQWTEFIGEQDKRWKHHQITNDEHWKDHERRHVELVAKVDDLSVVDGQLRAEITRLWRVQEAHAQTMTTFAHQWLEDFEAQGEKARRASGGS
jgi:DNA repair exonuclease SbcCD ATPase subunit